MTLGSELRISLHEIAAAVGINTRIVPHQFRHSFGTEMLRAGVSLPVLMKLLGHKSPNMTIRYLEVSLLDVEHEFHLARRQPRHLLPSRGVPTILTTISTKRGGEMFKQVQAVFPDQAPIDRTFINSWEDLGRNYARRGRGGSRLPRRRH
jgi:hypothetical protein